MLESSLGLSRSAPTTTTTTAPSLSRWIPPQPSRTRQCPMRVASKTLARLAASLAPSVSMSMTSTAMSSTAAKTSTPTPRRRQQVTLSSSSSSLSRSFASTAAAAAASSSSSSGASASTSRPESAQEKDRNDTPYSFVAASERGTALLASLLSRRRLPGDVLLLYGDVGAGKSAFARAFIRAAALDDELPVPSPTFLLHNVYDDDVVADGGPTIHHFDLYRLGGEGGDRVSEGSRRKSSKESSPSVSSSSSASASPSLSAIDAERCGLADALSLSSIGGNGGGGGEGVGVSLIEWADRLGALSSSFSSPSSSSSSSSSSSPPSSFRLEGEQRVLEVAIEPLSPEEVASSGVAERHPRLAKGAARSAGDDEDDETKDDDDDDEHDEFADTRWRRITLRPRGARARKAAEGAACALRENVDGKDIAIEHE